MELHSDSMLCRITLVYFACFDVDAMMQTYDDFPMVSWLVCSRKMMALELVFKDYVKLVVAHTKTPKICCSPYNQKE
jgi:hypothetical protein